MGSQQKQAQLDRKAQYGRKLERRLGFLKESGAEPSRIDKDTVVKKLRADIRAVDGRLAAIAAKEKRAEEQARVKAEKKAAAAAPAPPKEKKPEKETKKPAKEKASPEAKGEGKPKKEKAKKEPEPAS